MNKAFTLIELLVVVLIIGILSAVALPQYTKAVTKARFAEAFVNLKAIAQAHQAWILEQGGETTDNWCWLEDLPIDVLVSTKHFAYSTGYGDPDEALAMASYKDEAVCLCYTKDNRIIIEQIPDNCQPEDGSGQVSMDYAKLLNLPTGSCDCCR